MTQYGRPSSDITTTSWTRSSGTAAYYSYIDEAAADDADYLQTQTQGAGLEIKLGSVLDPLASTGHVVRFRYYVAGSSTAERQTVLLLQGATTRATVVNNATVTRNAWTQVDYTLTAGQADAITDYSDLRLRFTPGTLAAGETYRISWAVLRCV